MFINFHLLKHSLLEHDDLISSTCKYFVTFYNDFK